MAKIQLSPSQVFMLKMFADGWGFKLFNKRPGSWNTYWSLKRRGLITSEPAVKTSTNLVAKCKLTDMGRKALAQHTEHQQ